MKLTRSTLATLAAVACIVMMYGCGKSSDPTNVTPALDSTPPPAPESVTLAPVTNLHELTWTASSAADVNRYQVFEYRPDPTRDNAYVMLGETATNTYLLPTNQDINGFYRVRAVDQAGNRSAFSLEYNARAVAIETAGGTGTGNPDGDPDSRHRIEE